MSSLPYPEMWKRSEDDTRSITLLRIALNFAVNSRKKREVESICLNHSSHDFFFFFFQETRYIKKLPRPASSSVDDRVMCIVVIPHWSRRFDKSVIWMPQALNIKTTCRFHFSIFQPERTWSKFLRYFKSISSNFCDLFSQMRHKSLLNIFYSWISVFDRAGSILTFIVSG